MIRTALTAAAALALTAGVAFAQQPPASSTPTSPDTSAPAATPSADATAQANASTSSPGAMPAAPTMTSNAPAGDAPSSYPMCTKKGQDRCKSRSSRK